MTRTRLELPASYTMHAYTVRLAQNLVQENKQSGTPPELVEDIK